MDHIGIAVADLDAAIAEHARLYGFEVVHREENEAMQVAEAMLALPGTDTRLQLLAPAGAESPIAKFLDRRGPGLQQLAYRVRSIDECTRILTAAGIRLVYESAVIGTAGSRVNFIHPAAAGGVLVELVEPAVSS